MKGNMMSAGSPGLEDIADLLHRVARTGPYFVVTTGMMTAAGWRPVRTLYEDPTVLRDLVDRMQRRIGADHARVASSILFQGYAARLWSVGLGALVLGRQLPQLDPDALWWRDDDATMALHLADPAGREDPSLVAAMGRTVIGTHLEPLVRALHRLGPVADGLLWGNAAAALLSAADVLDGASSGPAHDVAAQIMLSAPLLGTTRQRPDGSHRRLSCCLFYRTPGGSLCADCALDRSPALIKQ